MTIIATGNLAYVVINGSGATTYTFAFKAFPTESDSAIYSVNVWLQDADGTFTPQVQGAGADYTVTTTSAAAEAGTITFKVAVPTTKKVIIASATPYTQPTDLSSSNAAITGPVLEKAFDRLEMQIRQLNRDISMSLHLEMPPEIWPITLVVDPNIQDGKTVFWQRDAVQPSTYHLMTSDFTIDNLKDLVDEIEQAVTTTQAAAAAAQTAANNAAAAAQTAANAVAQLNTSITQIIADLNAIKIQVQAIQTAIMAIDVEIKLIRDQVLVARDESLDALAQIQVLVSKFPDPVGQPINRTYVTDGAGHVTWEPYTPILNLDTALDGQVLTMQTISTGKALIAANPITTSEKVGTFDPAQEGGTTVSAALLRHENRLNLLEDVAPIYPFGKENVVADFIVNVDGNLRNTIDTVVIPKEGPTDLKYEYLINDVAYWTTGNNFTIPVSISSKSIFTNPSTLLFGVYIDANTPDTVLFSNTQFTIKKVSNAVLFIAENVNQGLPITLNEWVFYCLILQNNTMTAHVGHFTSGSVTIVDVPGVTLTTPIIPEAMTVHMETNLRMVRLTFIEAVVTKLQFETWLYALYGQKGSETYSLPDPADGAEGQVPVIVNGQYGLKYPFLLDPIATGWTIDNSLELPASISTGEYHTYWEVNATTKIAALKQKVPIAIPDPTTGTPGQAIVVNNGAYVLGNVPNFSNLPAGWTITDNINIATNFNTTGYFYWYFEVDATAKTIILKVANMNPSTTLDVHLFNTTPTPATPQLLIAANSAAKSRLVQNGTSYDITVGTQAALTSNKDQGVLIRSGTDYHFDTNGALYVLFPTGAGVFPANVYIRIAEEVLV